MELTGPVIDDMSIDGRLSITTSVLFAGATTGIINPDQKTIDHVKARTNVPFTPLRSDPDATYAKTYNFEVSDLGPQVVVPPYRDGAKPVSDTEGTKIDFGFIGSCASGRMEDLRIAAKILKDQKIHPAVTLNITPGSVAIYRQAIKEGILLTLSEANALIVAPSCGMCWGVNTPLAAGKTCITSSTTNYPGRMGSIDTKVYLANPATVAASAIEGQITDPREYL
jgi:3-isopropylmalate/(R)-2-methylmalate dehydratase large subunit